MSGSPPIMSGYGLSHERDPRAAAESAVRGAMDAGGIDRPDFVIAFATVGYDQEAVVKAIRTATDGAPLTGCSAEGVIVGGQHDESNFAVAVLALAGDGITVTNGLARRMSEDAENAGRAIGRTINEGRTEDSLALLIFPDGLTIDFDGLRMGIEATVDLDRPLPFIGGSAADNWEWAESFQYYDDEVVSDGVAWAFLAGDVSLVSAVNHGCAPLGVEHIVTASDGTTIFELDGRPALDVLRDYVTEQELEDWASATNNLPLGLRVTDDVQDYDDYIMRVMLRKDEDEGWVTIPTRIEPGTSLSVHRRDFDKTIAGVKRLADDLASGLDGATPQLYFHVECAGRGRHFLRPHQKTEMLDSLRADLPQAPWFGFYAYGEIGPVADENMFHNYTSVVAAFV